VNAIRWFSPARSSGPSTTTRTPAACRAATWCGPSRPACGGSGTDRIDVYFVHKFDPDTPIEETLHALDDLVRRGLILYPAVSNWAAWQIAKALGVSAREGWARFETIQPMYNLVKRQAEVEILPLAASEGLGSSPTARWRPACSSAATCRGARRRGSLVESRAYALRYARELESDVAERFVAYAAERGVHPATLAVAWVASHPAVTAPIVGARSVEQLTPSLAAAEFAMPAEMRAEIAALTPPVPIATDRTEDAPA
jgi:aryl-alcohol dehydrogenase-like predicted oxidoreductase